MKTNNAYKDGRNVALLIRDNQGSTFAIMHVIVSLISSFTVEEFDSFTIGYQSISEVQ